MTTRLDLSTGEGGARLPLDRHPVLATSDLDECREVMKSIWRGGRAWLRRKRDRYQARVHAVGLDSVGLSYGTNTPGLVVDLGPPESFFLVSLPLAGHSRHFLNKRGLEGHPGVAILHSPTEHCVLETVTDVETIHLRLDRLAVEQELVRMLGHPVCDPLEFEPIWQLADGAGRTLKRLVWFLIEELDDLEDPNRTAPLAVHQATRSLLTLLLEGQPHNFTIRLNARTQTAGPSAVRLVQEYIDANLQEPLSVGQLAALVGLSVRGLQLQFQRQAGCSPMAFVRRRRLEAAHRELAAGGPAGSVTEVAYRWGFGHLSHFAGAYRSLFGESPSETRHRQS